MLKTFDLRDRDAPLAVYGPPGTARAHATRMRVVYGRLRYPFDVVELEAGRGGRVRRLRDRRVPRPPPRPSAFGYAFVEDDRPGRFDAELATRARRRARPGLRPPAARRDRRRRAARAGRRARARRAAGSSSPATPRPCDMVRVAAHGADVLVHEATFTEEERDRARETGHSPRARRPRSRARPRCGCSR